MADSDLIVRAHAAARTAKAVLAAYERDKLDISAAYLAETLRMVTATLGPVADRLSEYDITAMVGLHQNGT